jgi:hypothetical protein
LPNIVPPRYVRVTEFIMESAALVRAGDFGRKRHVRDPPPAGTLSPPQCAGRIERLWTPIQPRPRETNPEPKKGEYA